MRDFSVLSRSSVIWSSLRVLELEGTSVTLHGLDQLLADLPGLACVESTAMEDFLHALQAALASQADDKAPQSNLRMSSLLKKSLAADSPPLGLQRLSLSIDRYGGGRGEPSLLGLIGQLFSQLTSLRLHHVHREEWRYLSLLANLQVYSLQYNTVGNTNSSLVIHIVLKETKSFKNP